MEGWIKIHRKLCENPLWVSEPFTRGQAWVDLILLANHEDGYFYLRGHKVMVPRGHVGWSILKLSERWKWSRSRVANFLNDLEREQQVLQLKSHSTSVIQLVNFEKYQEKGQQALQQKTGVFGKKSKKTIQQTEQQQTIDFEDDGGGFDEIILRKRTTDVTTDLTTDVTQTRMNKNEKKDIYAEKKFSASASFPSDKNLFKNEILFRLDEKNIPEEFHDYFKIARSWQDLFISINEQAGAPVTNLKKAKGFWIDEIRKLIEIDGVSVDQLREVYLWLPTNEFWKKNIGSISHLRNSFPKIVKEIAFDRSKSSNNTKDFTYNQVLEYINKNGGSMDQFTFLNIDGNKIWRLKK